ncbi:hypothetical protein [Pyrococcus kukulkanii]|uniref:hypothetical protein n=1 Tax=Pyrococcus kukulkanii TaxID=1609559 RepID=UPI000835A80C|nr:hypothetical protein [Pyrococcus kukulkanii]
MKGVLWKSLQSLYSWVKKEKYSGWDPYDWLSSPIASRLGNYLNFISLQLNVYSPINIRPWVGINKGISNKAIALFAQAYLILYSLTDLPEFKVESTRMLLLLDKNKIKTDSGAGWASHYFKFFGPKHLLTPSIPDIVGTCEALKAFSIAYATYKRNEYKNMASMAMNYLIEKHLSTDDNIIFFKYTPDERGKIVFNVSALALEATSYYLHFVNYAKK